MATRAALTAGGAAGWLGGIEFLLLVAWRWWNAGMFGRDILPHGWRVCTPSLPHKPNPDPCGALVTFWSLYTDLSSFSCPLALLSCLKMWAWLFETTKKVCAVSKSQFSNFEMMTSSLLTHFHLKSIRSVCYFFPSVSIFFFWSKIWKCLILLDTELNWMGLDFSEFNPNLMGSYWETWNSKDMHRWGFF